MSLIRFQNIYCLLLGSQHDSIYPWLIQSKQFMKITFRLHNVKEGILKLVSFYFKKWEILSVNISKQIYVCNTPVWYFAYRWLLWLFLSLRYHSNEFSTSMKYGRAIFVLYVLTGFFFNTRTFLFECLWRKLLWFVNKLNMINKLAASNKLWCHTCQPLAGNGYVNMSE